MKKMTLQSIADELGISKGTVDRALHNRPDINAETKRRVLALVRKYGYKPDKIASSLSRKANKIRVGVILHSIPEFFWKSVQWGVEAAEAEFSDFGLQVVFRNLHASEPGELLRNMDALIGERVDAIALVPTNDPALRQKIRSAGDRGIPVVTINDDIEDSDRIFYVGPQMKQSGRVAGELMGRYLGGKGSVIMISASYGKTESLVYAERVSGFREIIGEKYPDIRIANTYTYDLENPLTDTDRVIGGILGNIGEISGIYDTDGASLSNTGEYVKKNRRDNIVIVGHEIWSRVETLMSEGYIHACIGQDPYAQGYHAIRLLYDYLEYGQKPAYDRMYTRNDIILGENLTTQKNIINPYLQIPDIDK